MEHGSIAAFRRAMDNVEQFFPVVGVLERLEDSLRVMESKIPQFFRGISKLPSTEYSRLLRRIGSRK